MTDTQARVLKHVHEDGLVHTAVNDVRPTARVKPVTSKQNSVSLVVRQAGQEATVIQHVTTV